MAEFDQAVGVVLGHEGGLVRDPDDPGGLTNFGISQIAFPGLDVARLTIDDAKQIYLDKFWTPFHFEAIASQRVVNKVFDLAVNIGPVPAIRLLQQSIQYYVAGLAVADGKIGPLTISASAQIPEDKLVAEIKARAALYHAGLQKPTFLLGWLRRDIDG